MLGLLALLPASMIAAIPRPHGDDGDDESGKSLAGLIARLGTSDAAANELWRDNYKLRDERRANKAMITELQGKVPATGTVVLTPEQAAEWTAYQTLGKPAEVTKALETGKTASETMAKRERGDKMTAAAKAAGYNPEVFAQLAEMNNLELTEQTVTIDGKPMTVYNVKDATGTQMELTVYATQKLSNFMPALTNNGQQQQQNDGQGQGAGNGQQQNQGQGQASGQQWLGGGGAGAGGNNGGQGGGVDLTKMVDNLMGQRNSVPPNALQAKNGGGVQQQQNQGQGQGAGNGQGAGAGAGGNGA